MNDKHWALSLALLLPYLSLQGKSKMPQNSFPKNLAPLPGINSSIGIRSKIATASNIHPLRPIR